MQRMHIDPVELLDGLRSYPFLAGYSLAVYSASEGTVASRGDAPAFCRPPAAPPLPCAGAKCPLSQAAIEASGTSRPIVCQCHLSVLGFALPLEMSENSQWALVAWGVRCEAIDLSYLEKLTRKQSMNPFELLEQWGNLSATSSREIRQLTEEVAALLPTLQARNLHTRILEKTVGQMDSVVGIAAQIDQAASREEVFQLLGESLGIFFDIPMIAVAISDKEPQLFTIRGVWGLTGDRGSIPKEQFAFSNDSRVTPFRRTDFPELFTSVDAERVATFPLLFEGTLKGALLLYNVELHQRDTMQIRILCDKVAGRLKRLETGGHLLFDASLPDRLIAVTGSLAAAATKEELYQKILECSSALLKACSGSIMLLDESGTGLNIEAAIGINALVSRNVRIKVGEGIAGKVAKTGKPILVDDIETDTRIAAANRPRFKTKSFLSVPLKLKERLIGVLNLSDKENDEAFTEADLQLVSVLTTQVCILIERTELLEKTTKLEQLAMSDPLTGLYSRNSITKRMDEETNRSSRQGLAFSVLVVALDYYPIYSEIAGQESADAALKTTAAALTASARQMDALSRYDHDAFCIILPGTAARDALIVAERVRSAIRKEAFPCEENLPGGKLTASIGIASFPEDGEESASLLAAAEAALYRAKAEGRDRICTGGSLSYFAVEHA